MGLYISSHPLDKFDTFFEEQTHPYNLVIAENDGKTIILGGIISSVRTILTKSGSKMAFVKLEDKNNEQEVIVFPSVFEQVGAKLVQDNVIKVSGRINAKDQNGNQSSEIKVLADAIDIISDQTLETYQPTGSRLAAPRTSTKSPRRRSRSSAVNAPKTAGAYAKTSPTDAAFDLPRVPIQPPVDPRRQKLFCLINEPENTTVLSDLKHLCDLNPGLQEIILVLNQQDTKKPLRLPFKVDASPDLIESLENLLGSDCVKLS